MIYRNNTGRLGFWLHQCVLRNTLAGSKPVRLPVSQSISLFVSPYYPDLFTVFWGYSLSGERQTKQIPHAFAVHPETGAWRWVYIIWKCLGLPSKLAAVSCDIWHTYSVHIRYAVEPYPCTGLQTQRATTSPERSPWMQAELGCRTGQRGMYTWHAQQHFRASRESR